MGVKLLVQYQANVEHRAKTGLTPLMEAASGGYQEVGRVLIGAGADVNASPVATSRDTALTIASDKGHKNFCELLLENDAFVDAKNKRGNTPMWLACSSGSLEVIKLLSKYGADLNIPDNRGATPLVASFKKGHTRACAWLVKDTVCSFPFAIECDRIMQTLRADNEVTTELLEKCKECNHMIDIPAAKRRTNQTRKLTRS